MVLLSPFVNRTVVKEAKEKTVEISPKVEITDFIRPSASVPKPAPYPTPAPAAPAAPGFETLYAAFALFVAFILLLKKRRGKV